MLVGLARVVRNDADDVHRQLAGAPAIQDVGQAMIRLRRQDHHPLAHRGIAQRQRHAEPAGDSVQRVAQRIDVEPVLGVIEHDPGEEAGALLVVELLRLTDVAAVLEDRVGDGGDDAGPVGAGEGQQILGHDGQNPEWRTGAGGPDDDAALYRPAAAAHRNISPEFPGWSGCLHAAARGCRNAPPVSGGWARSSAVEHSLHTREVTGSIPVAPTISSIRCRHAARLDAAARTLRAIEAMPLPRLVDSASSRPSSFRNTGSVARISSAVRPE